MVNHERIKRGVKTPHGFYDFCQPSPLKKVVSMICDLVNMKGRGYERCVYRFPFLAHNLINLISPFPVTTDYLTRTYFVAACVPVCNILNTFCPNFAA